MIEGKTRVSAMDMQRGLIMALMAFSHCREYVGIEPYNNLSWNDEVTWKGSSFFDFLHQAMISMVAAGGFFMMMGIGIIFLYQSRLKDGWSYEKICQYLLKRGAFLVLIQITLLEIFECIAEKKFYLYAGVLLTLGICMMMAAISVFLIGKIKMRNLSKDYSFEYSVPLLLMILAIFSVHFVVNSAYHNPSEPGFWKILLFLGGHYQQTIDIDINFTPLPWFPAVALGLIVGQLMYTHQQNSFKFIGKLALAFLLSWILIRTANLMGWFSFGNFKVFSSNNDVSLASYFSVSKYPPDISYFLWALGINLGSIFMLHKLEIYTPKFIQFLQPLKIFGQCALFFFIIHWFIYYGISTFLSEKFSTPLGIGSIWLLGLIILYPLCKSFHAFKITQSKESIWRMF